MITTFYFSRYLKGRCHDNQFSGKWGKITYPLHLSLCQSKTKWDIATSMYALTAQMMPLYRIKISWTLVAPSGLYARLCYEFLVFLFFLIWAKLSQYLLGRFSRFVFTKWKVFAWYFSIRSSFSDSSRDVAMATNFVAKLWQNYLPLALITLSVWNLMGYRYLNVHK